MRAKGKRIGLVKLRLFRPFPIKDIVETLGSVNAVAVVDRAISAGGLGGPVYEDIRSVLYDQETRPSVFSFIAGLGGRDITVEDFESVGEHILATATTKKMHQEPVFLQVRV